MSKVTSYLFKLFIKAFKVLPFKRLICIVLRKINFHKEKYYQDIKFNGEFRVRFGDNNSFFMYNHGGTLENETFWYGLFATFENDTGWIWIQLCKCSEVVLDIGANTGIYSLIIKSMNPSAEVFAFEPSNNIFKKLVLNNKINNFNIDCQQVGISNKTGNQVFYGTPNTNETSASLSAEKLKNWDGYKGEIIEYNIETITLAQFIENNNIKKVDLIKMDIEMHEPEAIQGLGKYLELFKPVVLIEVLSDNIADELNKLIGDDYIKVHLKGVGKAEFVEKFKAVPYLWNYVFFHKDISERIRQNTTLKWDS
jgi:FkbM family methyltransferase